MYQATDSRQRRRHRQKGSSPISGNKRINVDVHIVPAKRISAMPQCEIPRDTPCFLIQNL